jgi:hypothetical protein
MVFGADWSGAANGPAGMFQACATGRLKAAGQRGWDEVELLLRRAVAPGKTEDRSVVRRREDGWPICPWCGEDELAAIKKLAEPSPDAVDICYVCGPVEVVAAG